MSQKIYSRRQLMAKAPEEDWSKHYLTFKVLSEGTITFTANNSTAAGKTIQYSTNNGETWSSFTSTTEIQSLGNFIAGTKVLVKGNNSAYGSGNGDNYNYFGGTAKIALYGNIMSMINGDAYIGKTSLSQNAALSSMFINNANLIDAKHLVLPATSITASFMYASMFQNCTALKRAPKELPARTAVSHMYNSMFRFCSSLVEAPVIQLRNLVNRTAWYMFQNCSKLNYIKAMFTTEPNSTRLHSWVYDVASSGTFVKNSAATWNVTGVDGIPSGWTVQTADE